MRDAQIKPALREQAKHSDLLGRNAEVLLATVFALTPAERKAKRDAMVEAYRQRSR